LNTKGFLAFLACMPLCGCTGALLKSKTAAPVAYMLSVRSDPGSSPTGAEPAARLAAPATGVPAIPVDLSILKPLMRPGLESDRIAARYPDRRLEFYAGAKWSGPLDEVLQDLAVQLFHQRGRLRSVSSESTRFVSGYWLEIEVEDFQSEYSTPGEPPVIKVHLLARLGRAADRADIGSFEASASQAAAADRLEPIVDAYERAGNAALAQIIDGAIQTLATTAAGR
jgi:ABC-type uncharacterized transport system auxiliary subunit